MFQKKLKQIGLAAGLTLLASPALAEVPGETAFVFNTLLFLIMGAFVMWMAAGFAMLESGMVRSKNVATICVKNISLFAIAGILYYVVGYNLMYSGVDAGWIGEFSMWSPDDSSYLGETPDFGEGDTYAAGSDWFFQMVFVATAASIVSGTLAERIKLWPFLTFVALLTAIIYPIQGAWTWGGGWLSEMGFSDFAGSTIVHSVGGWAALTGALFLGARTGRYSETGASIPMPGSSMPLATLGTFILWLGWFGFNGGSQLAADGGAAMALTVTHISAATASLTWALWEKIKYGTASLVGIVTGTIAGLASITPTSGFVGPIEALVIGAVAGILCQEAVNVVRNTLKIDDTLDVFAVHGVGGIFGTLMIAGFGHGAWVAQFGALIVVGIFTLVVSYILIKVIQIFVPLRVDAEAETNGLDLSAHGERAYDMNS